MRKIETKNKMTIEGLAVMVKNGFDNTATKDELGALRGDVEILKDDVKSLKSGLGRVESRLSRVESEVDALGDVTLTDIKKRVTKLEDKVFA